MVFSRKCIYVFDVLFIIVFYIILFSTFFGSNRIQDGRFFDMLFFLIPVCYLLIRKPKEQMESMKVACVVGIFITFISYLGAFVRAWTSDHFLVNTANHIHYVVLSVSIALWSVSIYEHFILRYKNRMRIDVNKTMRFLIISLILVGVMVSMYVFKDNPIVNQTRLSFDDFSYLKYVAPFSLLSTIIVLAKLKDYRISLILLPVFTFPLLFAYEIFEMSYYNGWAYTTKYIFMFNILGVAVPFEEIFFFILLGPVSMVSYSLILTMPEQHKKKINR